MLEYCDEDDYDDDAAAVAEAADYERIYTGLDVMEYPSTDGASRTTICYDQ